MIRSLILPALTATLTVWVLSDTTVPARPPLNPAPINISDVNVNDELRAGCTSLIDLALSGGQDAPWAISELQRATTASWATEALRIQAKDGLARVAEMRAAVATR